MRISTSTSMKKEFSELYQAAWAAAKPRRLSDYAEAGGVGAAILTKAGNLYTGVCIDSACSMGFCAEHAAAAAMVTAGEQEVARMVAVNHQGEILPPCGRCREFISQLAEGNKEAEILVEPDRAVRLRALLPCDWKRKRSITNPELFAPGFVYLWKDNTSRIYTPEIRLLASAGPFSSKEACRTLQRSWVPRPITPTSS